MTRGASDFGNTDPLSIGAQSYCFAASIGTASHLGKSASIAFADYHGELVLTGTLLKNSNFSPATYGYNGYCLSSGNQPATSAGNYGRLGDVQIVWNNSSPPHGYWSGNDGD